VVAGVIAGILLGELGYRLAGYSMPIKDYGLGPNPRFYFKADPVNGYDIAENYAGGPFELPEYIRDHGAPFTVSSNSLGCRDRSFDQEDGYVLLLGDSFTWGYVPLEQTWGSTLEQLIGTRVLKCGVSGYGPRQERHKLEAVVAKAGRPHLVIVGYTAFTDLLDDYLNPHWTVVDGYMVPNVTLADAIHGSRKVWSNDELQARLRRTLEQEALSSTYGVKDALAEHSALYNVLRNSGALRRLAFRFGLADAPPPAAEVRGLEAFLPIDGSPWLNQAWNEHLASLLELKSAVEAQGATMLVVVFPSPEQVYEFLRPRKGNLQWEYPNRRLSEFFQNEHIAFLDLLSEFRCYASHRWMPMLHGQVDLYWPHDGHPNAKGNALAGLLISRYVLEQSFLEVHDKTKRLSDIKQFLTAMADVTCSP
jgi:hypothetical protein